MKSENEIYLELIDYMFAMFNVATKLFSTSLKSDEIIVGNMRVSVSDEKHNAEETERDELIEYLIQSVDSIEEEFGKVESAAIEEHLKVQIFLDETISRVEEILSNMLNVAESTSDEISELLNLNMSIIEFTHDSKVNHSLLENEIHSFNYEASNKLRGRIKFLFGRKAEEEFNHSDAVLKLEKFKYKVNSLDSD